MTVGVRGGRRGMFIVYMFVLRLYDDNDGEGRERERERDARPRTSLYTNAERRNSNDVASFCVPSTPLLIIDL
jgi:hypothetical protein